MSVPRQGSGWIDKLYWREESDGLWHCYKKTDSCFGSLCYRSTLQRVGGQACQRPIAELRCGVCDSEEMDRRGWKESGSKNG